MNRFIKSMLISTLLFGAATIALSITGTTAVTAHDSGEDHSHDTAQSEEADNNNSYNYVAQPGDTYTQMARKAIQTYGIENSVNLSVAEIVFAETRMTQEAGSPALNVGQEVSLSKDTVKKWIESAQALDDTTEARWNVYARFVDFNTNDVGERRNA